MHVRDRSQRPSRARSALVDSALDLAILPGETLRAHLRACRRRDPDLFACLALDRLRSPDAFRALADMVASTSHFDGEAHGGRGGAYRTTQLRFPLARAVGISRLFELACGSHVRDASLRILDVLGGNGTLARALSLLWPATRRPTVFTSDASADMVADALSLGIAALRQPAQYLLFRDASVDGVIFAYGTHHIPLTERPTAIAEAWRILRAGGRVVLQDFETGTPTARWYSEVLHRYTTTGHAHEHFTRQQMRDLLEGAGFVDVDVFDVYDPCVLHGATADEARMAVLLYMIELFSLVKLLPDAAATGEPAYWDRVEAIFGPYTTFDGVGLPRDVDAVPRLTVRPDGARYRAELPRIALVGVGTRR